MTQAQTRYSKIFILVMLIWAIVASVPIVILVQGGLPGHFDQKDAVLFEGDQVPVWSEENRYLCTTLKGDIPCTSEEYWAQVWMLPIFYIIAASPILIGVTAFIILLYVLTMVYKQPEDTKVKK